MGGLFSQKVRVLRRRSLAYTGFLFRRSPRPYNRKETSRLAQEMPPKEITATQDETFTGSLCLVAIEPVSNYILLEHTAEARDHDPWQALMQPALAGLNCRVIQATSDEAPGLLAYVEHHLGAHHSPDLFHVQHELSKAVSVPLATKQQTAAKAVTKAEETLKQAHEYLAMATNAPVQRGPGRPPKGVTNLEQVKDALEGARDAHQRLSAQCEQVTQCIRAIGHAYHFVDLECGVRRNGQLIAGDIHAQLQTIRTIAQQADLSQVCLKRASIMAPATLSSLAYPMARCGVVLLCCRCCQALFTLFFFPLLFLCGAVFYRTHVYCSNISCVLI